MGQMDNVVARLSDIDAAAKKIMDQAALKKKDMEAENRQRQKAFEQELESKTKETLEELSQRLEERSGRQLEKLKEENGRSLEALEKTFAGSRQMLADELFQKLIEVS